MATNALSMLNFVSGDMQSTVGTRYSTTGGGYGTDGRWIDGTEDTTPHDVNLQPATPKQIDSLDLGGERAVDVRNVWVNDTEIALAKIAKADEWTFDGVAGRFKCVKLDNRSSFQRDYCKAVVSLIDGSDA